MLNEIETLTTKTGGLEQQLKELRTERLEFEKMVYEKMQLKIEKDVFEKVEDAICEAKASNRKMMIVVVIGCMIMIGCSKLLG